MKINVAQIAHLPTPFYFYDLKMLHSTLDAVKSAKHKDSHIHIHYAIKANANERILQEIAKSGLGADCVSGGEVEAAVKSGFPTKEIVFAGIGKADWEINLALDYDIHSFNVESLPELEVINDLAAKKGKIANVAFRINPNVDAHTLDKITTGLAENKFGIAIEEMLPAIKAAEVMSHINYIGLHFHIGSNILNLENFIPLCKRINMLQDILEAEGIITRSINVGGGLGTHYEDPDKHLIPDFESYIDVFRNHLKLRTHQELHFELGRSIVAQCGMLISKVLYVKKGVNKQFLILDAGFTDLIRPAFYNAHHRIENISSQTEELETYDVVGPICESSDVFQRASILPKSKRGDIIAFRTAGAYGQIMASKYNLRKLPGAYYCEE